MIADTLIESDKTMFIEATATCVVDTLLNDGAGFKADDDTNALIQRIEMIVHSMITMHQATISTYLNIVACLWYSIRNELTGARELQDCVIWKLIDGIVPALTFTVLTEEALFTMCRVASITGLLCILTPICKQVIINRDKNE